MAIHFGRLSTVSIRQVVICHVTGYYDTLTVARCTASTSDVIPDSEAETKALIANGSAHNLTIIIILRTGYFIQMYALYFEGAIQQMCIFTIFMLYNLLFTRKNELFRPCLFPCMN